MKVIYFVNRTLQNKFQKLVEETNEQDDDGVEKTTDNFAIEESTPTVKYRLKIKPNQSSLSYAANISKLENRLNKLESLIGSGNPELVSETCNYCCALFTIKYGILLQHFS